MTKTYVIDTNVLIHAPHAIDCFEDNNVLIPMVVMEELDGLKKAEGDRGASAREAIRNIERYRAQGDLLSGIRMRNGGVLKIEMNCTDVSLPEELLSDKMDNRILRVCKGHAQAGEQIILVTKDVVMRIKADVLGIAAEDFTTEQVPKEQYTGRTECYVSEEKFKDFKKKGVNKKYVYLIDEEQTAYQPELVENEFVILRADQSVKKTHLGRVEGERIVPLIITRAGKGTKIIILGDPNQIDNTFLDERTNGLSYAAEYMKGSPFCCQITLTADESERSALAADAIRRL